jgi:hypothetical protein
MLHSARRPGACSPSRSDGSGTPRGEGAIHTIYIRGVRRLRSVASEKETLDLAANLLHRSVEGLAPGIDDNGPLWTQTIQTLPHRFTDAAADPVADHGLTDRARKGEPDPRTDGFRLPDTESREQGTGDAGPVVVDPSEIFGAQQADTFRETSDGRLPFGADRELLAPAGTAPGEYGAPILRLHARAESMSFCAVTVIRLKSAFRHYRPTV